MDKHNTDKTYGDSYVEAHRLVMPDIRMHGNRYTWDNEKQEYLGIEGSCGRYGAALHEGKWIPTHIHADHWELEWADESFETPEEAIERSCYYFS